MLNSNEYLGLPCVGKSWVQKKFKTKVIVSYFAGEIPAIKKLKFIILALLHKPKILIWTFNIFIHNRECLSFLRHLLKIFILLSRQGMIQNKANSSLDEGVLQALWGMINKLPLSNTNFKLITGLINYLNVGYTITYIYTTKDNYLQRIADRQRKHPFISYSSTDVQNARYWMAFLIRAVKSRNIKLKHYRN
jgi:hypothetical protein